MERLVLLSCIEADMDSEEIRQQVIHGHFSSGVMLLHVHLISGSSGNVIIDFYWALGGNHSDGMHGENRNYLIQSKSRRWVGSGGHKINRMDSSIQEGGGRGRWISSRQETSRVLLGSSGAEAKLGLFQHAGDKSPVHNLAFSSGRGRVARQGFFSARGTCVDFRCARS